MEHQNGAQNAPSYMLESVLNTPLSNTSRDLTDSVNILLWKRSVFIVLSIIPHTVFETFITSNSRYKTQKVSWWVLWVGDAKIIHESFHYWNLKLSIVAISSVATCSPLKWKKNHQKNVSHLKNDKSSSHS